MSDNVVVAIIAGSAVVISAICVLGAGVFTLIGNNKRLERIEKLLETIQGDLREFFKDIDRLKVHTKLEDN